jgi:hypothetical protein
VNSCFVSRRAVRHSLLVVMSFLLLMACSPALNWREVRLGGMVLTLPCKPDKAERSLRLGGQEVQLVMVGCEAAGALFAVSHTPLAGAAPMDQVVTAWREAALANMQASSIKRKPSERHPGAELWTVLGKRADGSAVQAQFEWVTSGPDLYHLALYADHITPAVADPFFSDAKIP